MDEYQCFNFRYLEKPPEATMPSTSDTSRIIRNTLVDSQDSISILILKQLKKEMFLLSKSMKNNCAFRREKSFSQAKEIVKRLKKWEELDLYQDFDNIIGLLPQFSTSSIKRVPTIPVFEYLLTRIGSGFQLFLYIARLCYDVAGSLMLKVKTGHFYMKFMSFLAFVSRIRALTVDLAVILCECYNQIYPLYIKLKIEHKYNSDVDLPPKLAIHFNEALKGLIDVPDLYINRSSSYSYLDKYYDNFSDEEEEHETEHGSATNDQSDYNPNIHENRNWKYLKNDKRKNSEENNKSKNKKTKIKEASESFLKGNSNQCDTSLKNESSYDLSDQFSSMEPEEEDLGQQLSQEEMNALLNERSKSEEVGEDLTKLCLQYKKVNKLCKHFLSPGDVKKFIKSENAERQNKTKDRISKQLKAQDWKTLKGEVKNLSSQNNEKVFKKMKMLVKYWLINPKYRGRKPSNWDSILLTIKSRK